jgi:BirA family transcriptional regulator, biotin operon repressor / biotin---[acetyl-CoA-carboxylase] ligase
MRSEPEGTEERLARWEGESVAALQRAWRIPELRVYRRVASTNDIARGLAEAGAPVGTCVIAEEQVAGRGRENRAWASPPGLGIWMSVVLRPEVRSDPGVIPLLVGVAVASALDRFCRPYEPMVKWPNDILLAERKLGGILCEAVWSGTRAGQVVAGIGLNVLHLEEDFPPELRASATSIRQLCLWSPSRPEIAGSVARAVLDVSSPPVLTPGRLAELQRRDALRGKPIVVEEGSGTTFLGVADGIEADGTLRTKTNAGELRRTRTGTVRLAASGDA